MIWLGNFWKKIRVEFDLLFKIHTSNDSFLNLLISESGEQTNHSLGVHWLMRAADQGHQNALQMLSECFRTRRGIDDRNECEVCPRPTTM